MKQLFSAMCCAIGYQYVKAVKEGLQYAMFWEQTEYWFVLRALDYQQPLFGAQILKLVHFR